MKWTGLGLVSLALALGLGAFGTHYLQGQLSESLLSTYKTGNLYHLLVSILIIALSANGSLMKGRGNAMLVLIVLGLAIFSGSLYALSLTSVRLWGAVTPVGGVAMIGGCLGLALKAFRSKETESSTE